MCQNKSKKHNLQKSQKSCSLEVRNKTTYREHSSLQWEPLITNKLSRRKPTTFPLERISELVYINLELQQFRRTHSLCLYSLRLPKPVKQIITEHGLLLFSSQNTRMISSSSLFLVQKSIRNNGGLKSFIYTFQKSIRRTYKSAP